jgi:Ni/Fe-hydrogenase subunit HybB-like protein
MIKPKLTVWRVIFIVLALAGLYSTYLRVMYGLGGSTNLSDKFPWGIWIGFDILCGVGLAAGGFTLVAVVHIFNIERYHPILRPSILTAFLGYVLVVFALLFDLGRPDRLWHPLVMWNPHSVMFEVAWCVTLYSTVLALEFAPVVLEKFELHQSLRVVRAISVPLMIAGVILSTLHQSSLGTLYLIVPHKLYGLWYTPLLPVLFYISAIGAGLAMTIFESWHSAKSFGRALELPLLTSISRVLAVVLAVYLTVRYLDLSHRGAFALLAQNRTETWLFLLEILLIAAPMVLLFQRRVRQNKAALYWCSVLYLFGFITNRLNVAVTGMEAGSGAHYIPKWTEMSVTLSIIALGFAIFRVVAHYFPIFEAPEEAALAPVEEARPREYVGVRDR